MIIYKSYIKIIIILSIDINLVLIIIKNNTIQLIVVILDFKNKIFSNIMSGNLFLVGLFINSPDENSYTGAEEHKLELNLIKSFLFLL